MMRLLDKATKFLVNWKRVLKLAYYFRKISVLVDTWEQRSEFIESGFLSKMLETCVSELKINGFFIFFYFRRYCCCGCCNVCLQK